LPSIRMGRSLPIIRTVRRVIQSSKPVQPKSVSPSPSFVPSPLDEIWDAIVIGSGIGGLVTATQLAVKGARVLVLERYLIPGGSAGFFERNGYRFDVGASMIFGFGNQGTTNLLTRALDAVGMHLETIPDPVQVHYHLPDHLDIRVHRDYEQFLETLGQRFPTERQGIRRFYDECWKVFHCLNSIELLSLEEPRYVARVFLQHPLACLGLAKRLPVNVGTVARRHIRDPELLGFIDMECYCWSVVPADRTPLINAGMVFSDRHYGGVNYPRGGVGCIAQALVSGLEKSRRPDPLSVAGHQCFDGKRPRRWSTVGYRRNILWETDHFQCHPLGYLLWTTARTVHSPLRTTVARALPGLSQLCKFASWGRCCSNSCRCKLPPHFAGTLGHHGRVWRYDLRFHSHPARS
jgi:hypothetical protein